MCREVITQESLNIIHHENSFNCRKKKFKSIPARGYILQSGFFFIFIDSHWAWLLFCRRHNKNLPQYLSDIKKWASHPQETKCALPTHITICEFIPPELMAVICLISAKGEEMEGLWDTEDPRTASNIPMETPCLWKITWISHETIIMHASPVCRCLIIVLLVIDFCVWRKEKFWKKTKLKWIVKFARMWNYLNFHFQTSLNAIGSAQMHSKTRRKQSH